MTKLSKAKKIHKEVFQLFHYMHDIKNYLRDEHWTSHADDVIEGKEFSDDCDGFALTCCELLIRDGFDRSNVKAIICDTETGESHLVCGVDIDSTTYILDNRYDYVFDWAKKRDYTWRYYKVFSMMNKWFQVT